MKISLVIPVYNEADRIVDCLRAVQAQTIPPDEVLVVDNNSTDNTVALASRFAFVTVVHEPRQGSAFASRQGFEHAQGRIIARIDADSHMPPDWIANVIALFDNDETAAGVTGPPRFTDVPWARFWNASQVIIYQKLQRLVAGSYVLWGSNMAVRRSAWQQVRSDIHARSGIDEDIDLSLCLQKHSLKVVYCPQLPMPASLRRGNISTFAVIRYLSTWPRDYFVHRRYLAAGVIALLSWLLVIMSLPITLPLSLRYSIRSRPYR